MARGSLLLSIAPLHLLARALRPAPIFQIGFNKCGTASLHEFFSQSGIASAHWGNGMLARRIVARMNAGQDPIRDFPRTIAFTDMIAMQPGLILEPYKRFDYLHRWYPNALFILNTRDREGWIASRASHHRGTTRFITRYSECLCIPEADLPDFWRAEWDTHHISARAYFQGSPDFLEFNIELDDPQTLREFVGRRYRQCAQTPFGNYNRSGDHKGALAGVT